MGIAELQLYNVDSRVKTGKELRERTLAASFLRDRQGNKKLDKPLKGFCKIFGIKDRKFVDTTFIIRDQSFNLTSHMLDRFKLSS